MKTPFSTAYISGLIGGAVLILNSEENAIRDWQKLVLIAKWSYFQVVLKAEFYCTAILYCNKNGKLVLSW